MKHSGATYVLPLQDGRVSHLDHVFLRGSRIRFMIIPDMLKNAPMFKRIDPKHKVCCLPLCVDSGCAMSDNRSLADWSAHQHQGRANPLGECR